MDYDTCYIAMLRWVHFESYCTKQRETVNELQVYVLANKKKQVIKLWTSQGETVFTML